MIHLIIGKGEIGTALGRLIENSGQFVYYHDPVKHLEGGHADVTHICIPYSDNFVSDVNTLISRFSPDLTIIHSTVQIGTTSRCGDNVAYSFARGRHPTLDNMVRETKHVGGVNPQVVEKAVDILKTIGFKTMAHDNPEVVELGKLLDTSYYGICLAFNKYSHSIAEDLGVNFEDIKQMNHTYNEGAKAEGWPQFVRPEIDYMPGPIGGHCVVPNARILGKKYPHKLLESIEEAK